MRIVEDRFEIVGRLGEGEQGTILHVLERETSQAFALKVIPALSASAALDIKHEFRIAASLHHPNLVRLHELIVDRGVSYFTMELVPGSSLDFETVSGLSSEERERLAGDLVEAIAALHQAGRLHRDIKLENLLYSSDRGLVVLDYGFMSTIELGEGDGLGTPTYVAPELVRGQSPSVESDWFSVGVLLLELFTGVPVERGLRWEPPVVPSAPDAVEPGVWSIVRRLVSAEPSDRPDWKSILRALGRNLKPAGFSPSIVSPGSHEAIIGREPELEKLAELAEPARSGSSIVHVRGPAGIGKTSLVTEFLHRVGPSLTTYRGRCSPREDLAYNAFDDVVDSVAREILERDQSFQAEIDPRHAYALGRLFPVLSELIGTNTEVVELHDSETLTRFAMRGLSRIIARLSSGQTLLWIDDLHWADLDSWRLLGVFLEESRFDPILIVLSSRDLDLQLSGAFDRTELVLGPIDFSTRVDLARQWSGLPESDLEQLAEDCEGLPLLLRQLADGPPRGMTESRQPSLDEAIAGRLSELPPSARATAELLAIMGKPISSRPPTDEISPFSFDPRDLYLLHDKRLIKGRYSEHGDEVEVYHDRIREVLIDLAAPERVIAHHLQSARLLEERGGRAEEVAFHYVEGGQVEEAAQLLVRVADQAAAQLAFNRAADLYGRILEISELAIGEYAYLWRGYAKALSKSGRGAEAADAYLKAAEIEPGIARTDLQRAAMEQYLRVGYVDEGLALFDSLAKTIGLPTPKTWVGTASWVVWSRLRNRLAPNQGVGASDELEIQRIDTCFSAGLGFNMIDFRRSLLYQNLQLRYARSSRDPASLARALAVESTYAVMTGTQSGDAEAERLLQKSRELSREAGDPEAQAFADLCAGVRHTLAGEFHAAIPFLDRAQETYRSQTDGVTWELVNCDLYKCWSYLYTGELAILRRIVPRLNREAIQRGDRIAGVSLSSGPCIMAELAEGEPQQAMERAIEARSFFPDRPGMNSLDYFDTVARCSAHLYQRNGRAAYLMVRSRWASLRRGFFLNLRFFRSELRFLRARAAVAAALQETGREREKLVADAKKQSNQLVREGSKYSRSLASAANLDLISLEAGTLPVAALRQFAKETESTIPLLSKVASSLSEGGAAHLSVEDRLGFSSAWLPATTDLFTRRLDVVE